MKLRPVSCQADTLLAFFFTQQVKAFTERGDTEKNLRENLCVVAHITGDSASKKTPNRHRH